MKAGFLGAGTICTTLARPLSKSCYDVKIVNTRDIPVCVKQFHTEGLALEHPVSERRPHRDQQSLQETAKAARHRAHRPQLFLTLNIGFETEAISV
ncbi:hypothetical protein [Arthrobacter sp. NicSoilB8]|uniref:hypothetical protein n=1 Tax=Arthrobacter sp. NicSoilB8 TaxID=2830998 RepID=UPI001CC559BD|nr:hypothetical protein [Arthrobacter sp. NicSoilB8]BCW70710.1 hypothetical protein NicSoilB8_17540 [Arthrobacter sp. NicSoilB8]